MENVKIDQIITDLGDANDDLLALLDDLWLEIDHTSTESVRIGSGRMISLLESIQRFQEARNDVADKLRSFLPTPEKQEASDTIPILAAGNSQGEVFAGKAKISLQENFSYRRPFGFRLKGESYPSLRTWIAVYEKLCLILRKLNPVLFDSLPDREEMVSTHGNCYFSRDRTALRSPLKVSENIFAESNLSAKLIRDLIKKLIAIFRIQESDIEFFLRR